MKVIFHENQLTYRGTSNALYNYAVFNEELLGNESVIMYNRTNKNNHGPAIERFKARFKVIPYDTIDEIEELAKQENAQMFYAIKMGKNDGIEVKCCKTCIHTVFKANEPHGDVYAYVSKWLSEEMSGGKLPYVPHMIYVEPNNTNLRAELGIPEDAIVFGRHGGGNTFDIPFVKSAVKQVARKRKDIYFLFMGTDSFVTKTIFRPYKNIIFLPATVDEKYKSRFINTCDAYLHARKQGESFGISIGEFSVSNKPVITWTGSRENSHIDLLGNKAILYKDKDTLKDLLINFTPDTSKNWDAYSEEFSPEKVMQKFKSVFIDG